MYNYLKLTKQQAESVKTDRINPIETADGWYVLPIKLIEKYPELDAFEKVKDFNPKIYNLNQ
jgi:hypothetical protein